MKIARNIRLGMCIILGFIFFVVAHPVEAKSLDTGEVYSSLDGERAIEAGADFINLSFQPGSNGFQGQFTYLR